MEQNYVPLISSILGIFVVLIGFVAAIAKAYHRIEEVVKENADLKLKVERMETNQNGHNTDIGILKVYHEQVMASVGEVKTEVTRIYELIRTGKG